MKYIIFSFILFSNLIYALTLNKYLVTERFLKAAYDGCLERVKAELASGLDVNVVNSQGDTALHFAAASGYLKGVRLLLDSGADANILNNNGWKAIDCASVRKLSKVVEILERWSLQVEQARARTLKLRYEAVLTRINGLCNWPYSVIPCPYFQDLVMAIEVKPKTTDPLPGD